MKIPWFGNRCIICLREDPLTEEHLIPESLGGRLTCDFLCVTCNSTLGSALEATAKSDPSILLAAQNLAGVIPSLSKALLESHPYVGHSELGPAVGYIKNGAFRIQSKTLEDGSLIQPNDEARKSLATILKKSGVGEAPIKEAIATFEQAPEDIKIEIAPGLVVTKWSNQRLELDLSKAQLMDSLIPVKIAYEFLACHVSTAIYDDTPQLSEIRDSLSNNILNPKAIRVERLISNKYEPFHGICFEGNDPYAKVQIRLFGWLAFRVHFLRLAIGGQRFVYTHSLDSKKENVGINDKNLTTA